MLFLNLLAAVSDNNFWGLSLNSAFGQFLGNFWGLSLNSAFGVLILLPDAGIARP